MTKCKKPTPYDPKLIAERCNPLAIRPDARLRLMRPVLAASRMHGRRSRDGDYESCGKPVVAIRRWMRTDGPDCEDMPETGWYGPVCKTHANHDVVPLAVILDVMTGGRR